MSAAYRAVGGDGRTHFVWATSDAQAVRDLRPWGRRHGGLARVEHLTPVDEREGCWDRASVRQVAVSS